MTLDTNAVIDIGQARSQALSLHGLRHIGPDHAGVSFEERWERAFSALTLPAPETIDHAIRGMMGSPDFGRERGDVELWSISSSSLGDPDKLEPVVDPTDGSQAVALDLPGRTLIASIYTRNGGGNRECWCTGGEHEAGCLAKRIDALEARPDFAWSQVDEWDGTYATFYFHVEPGERLQRAVEDAPLALRRHRAATHLTAILDGQLGPWSVMAINPHALERLSSISKRARTPLPTITIKDTRLTLFPHEYRIRIGDLDRLDRVIGSRPLSATETDDAFGKLLDRAAKRIADHKAAQQAARDRKRLQELIDAGNLPALAAAELRRPMVVRQWQQDEKDADRCRKLAEETMAALRGLRASIKAAEQAAFDRAQDEANEERLRWILGWPRDPALCPPKPS